MNFSYSMHGIWKQKTSCTPGVPAEVKVWILTLCISYILEWLENNFAWIALIISTYKSTIIYAVEYNIYLLCYSTQTWQFIFLRIFDQVTFPDASLTYFTHYKKVYNAKQASLQQAVCVK